jgi:hypothetical protein
MRIAKDYSRASQWLKTEHFVTAITSVETIVRHTPICRMGTAYYAEPSDAQDQTVCRSCRYDRAGFGVWAASNSNAHVAPSVGQVDPIQVMTTAKDLPPTVKDLPTIEFADHTFVFPH